MECPKLLANIESLGTIGGVYEYVLQAVISRNAGRCVCGECDTGGSAEPDNGVFVATSEGTGGAL